MDIGRKKELVTLGVMELVVKQSVHQEQNNVVEMNLKHVTQQELHGWDNHVRMDVKRQVGVHHVKHHPSQRQQQTPHLLP